MPLHNCSGHNIIHTLAIGENSVTLSRGTEGGKMLMSQ